MRVLQKTKFSPNWELNQGPSARSPLQHGAAYIAGLSNLFRVGQLSKNELARAEL